MTERLVVLGGVLAAAFVAATSANLAGQTPAAAVVPTFTKDVAPIVFNNCATCHRPGEVAPMSLLSYEDARPWSKAIREKVVKREMPPWHADPRYSKFRNDRSLSQKEIDTIIAWVDGGAPKGNDADLPPMPKFASGWVLGEPDYIVEMPVEYKVPAEGEVPVQIFYSKVPFDTDRFVEAIEMRPSNYRVVHHANVHFVQLPEGATVVDGQVVGENGKPVPRDLVKGVPDESVFETNSPKLISYVPGRGYERYRPGVTKRVKAGTYMVWSQHYTPSGQPETDRTRIGLYFAKGPVTHEIYTQVIGNALPTDPNQVRRYVAEGKEIVLKGGGTNEEGREMVPNIPAYADNWTLVGVTPVTENITAYSFHPHFHLRGKEVTYVLTYPDGREETILHVPKYDFNWQLNYELEQPLKIPAGSKLTSIIRFDNSLKNPYNPAPHLEVHWSEQSWDEMYSPFIEISIDSLDLTKGRKNTQQQ